MHDTKNDKINDILTHPVFQEQIHYIETVEKDRAFCKHGLQHCLEVARIMYIITLEQRYSFSKEVIYATALLHDIGRGQEYKEGTPHHLASSKIAQEVLRECSFSEQEIQHILCAIENHRQRAEGISNLANLLYSCDKQSRNCFSCKAIKECKWPEERKNLKLTY